MSARYRISHSSRYDYDHSVAASLNEARLTPLQTPWQLRLESGITIEPVTWNYRYTDYWGTEVRVFEVSGAHRCLDVRSTSLVEVDTSRRPAADDTLGWDDLRAPAVRDGFVEYLTQTELTDPPDELAELAAEIASEHEPAQTAHRVAQAVHETLRYLPGATEVKTRAAEAWASRSGVCQDFTHLVVGALRHVGLPARYVSGYLHPRGEPQIGDTARGESHAWVEFWLGEWAAQDPTNMAEVAERHVMIGTGRDYHDVPPIKGIVAGAHSAVGLSVAVELTRLA